MNLRKNVGLDWRKFSVKLQRVKSVQNYKSLLKSIPIFE